MGSTKGGPSAAMAFNPAFTNNNPVAVFRGTNGGSTRVSYWGTADMGPRGSSSGVILATNDFTFGSVDAMVDQMILGQDPVSTDGTAITTANSDIGVLKFNAGIFDVNTLILGNQQTTAANANVAPLVGKVFINGNATLKVNTVLKMGFTAVNTTSSHNSFGQLNVTNGTVLANSITVASNTTSANNQISLSNAVLIVSNTLATSAFPLTNYFTANSLLGLTITSDSSTKAFVGTLTTAGATNVIQINPVPAFFGSYPAQIALIKYSTLAGSGYNFGLTNLPGWAANAVLSNNVANKSIDLILPADPRPVITAQPSSYSGSPGDNVTTNFAVIISAGSVTPLSYQWYYFTNGGSTNLLTDGFGPSGISTISGTTNGNLQMLNATNTDSGNYFVVITNAYGSVTSSAAILTISAGGLPVISPVPQNQTVIQGNNATFTAGVSANPPATIVWQTFGTNIPGATASTLIVTNVQYPANDQESYSIIASNSFGNVTNSATLTVIVPPTLVNQPTNLVVTNTQSASFSVTITGAVPAEAYQWKKNGTPISPAINSTATNATFTISSVSSNDIANYSVTITNLAGATNSASASLIVNSLMAPTALSPGNSATGICYDTPLYITFNQIPVLRNTGTIKIFNVTNTTTPVDTINLGSNFAPAGSSIPSIQPHSLFPGDAQVINYYPVIITSNTAAIYPHGGVMTSNQTYYVTIDDGAFTDTNGAYFAGITASNVWQFTTKPTGPANPTNLVVAADGSGDFVTVQGAVDSVLPGNNNFTVVNIRNGIYTEIVNVSGKNNITFRGQSRTGTVVGYPNNNNNNPSTASRMAFKANANDLKLENLTLTNGTPQGGSQAETLMVFSAGLRCIANNCDIVSRQDTVLINNSTSQCFFNNCKIIGNFDYIWGQGVGYFNNCVLHTISGASQYNLTAARTVTSGALSAATPWVNPNGTTFSAYGFSFVGCTLEADSGVTTVTLAGSNGTPGGLDSWANCLINTNFYVNPLSSLPPSSYVLWQYNNTFTDGVTSVTFTNLQTIGVTNNDPRLLAATNAPTWFSGWVPQMLPNIISQPTNLTLHSGSATFTVGATGIPNPAYQWLSNSVPIANATSASFTISNVQVSSAATYSVIVSNAVGSVTSSNATLTVNDNPPVANTSTYARPSGLTLKIAIPGDLATNWSDPDGDTVTLTGGISSTNGATVSYDTNYVYYSNPNNVTDQINYTIGDGLGLTAAGVINVTIAPASTNQTQNIVGPPVVNGDGSLTINFASVPNTTNVVQWTTNLATQAWTSISTNVAGTNGLWNYTDGPPAPPSPSFYRSRRQP